MRQYKLQVIPGDGIGVDVIDEGLKLLSALEEVDGGVKFQNEIQPWSCEYYAKTGDMMPKDGIKILSDCDSILLGAVGFPGVPDHVSLWGLLLPIRKEFDQYVNLRPIKLLPNVPCPLANKEFGDIDFVVVRENTEGEYSGVGGRQRVGTPQELALQTAVFTRFGTERIVKYAMELAQKRAKKLHSVTKSNALNYSMVFWDEVVNDMAAKQYSDLEVYHTHVDAMAAFFVTKPETFDVVVASNLFGDILTDLGSALQGSIGIAPSANINPEKKYPSMFEPIHGSAPDIAGKGIANPIGTFWTIQMMLDHLGEQELAQLTMKAIEEVCKDGILTPDVKGNSTTTQVGDAVVQKIHQLAK